MEKIKESWQVIVFTMLITLIGSTFLSYATIRNSKVDNAASIDYVDKGDEKLDCKIEAQRLEVDENLEKKADKTTVKQMQHTLDVIDGRIYDMWKDSHENN